MPTPPPEPDRALEEAARRYAASGRWAHGFARGKLRGDPAYRAVIGHLVDRPPGRLLDLGCGEGYLLALVRAALPRWRLVGIDHDPRRLAVARAALGAEPDLRLVEADAATADLPPADAIACLDVLHYLAPGAQDALIARLADALRPGGLLLVRDGRADLGWRSALTVAAERLALAWGRHRGGGVHLRPLADWEDALRAVGLAVLSTPCHAGTPFANVLLLGRRP